jgi:cytochrome c556
MRRSKITYFDEALKEWLETELVKRKFSRYTELTEALNEKLAPYDLEISRSAVHAFGAKLEQSLETIRSGTAMAALIAKEVKDDADDMSGAVLALIKQQSFAMLLALKKIDEETDFDKRSKLLANMGKMVADIARASKGQKQYAAQQNEKIEQKLKSLEAQAKATGGKAKGLDKATLARVRQELYGIVA